MHARIEHLLSVRDAEAVDAGIAAHVAHCPSCSAELHRLSSMRERLRALPPLDAPPSSWEQILLRREHAAAPRGRGMFAAAAAAAIVMLSAVAFVALREPVGLEQTALNPRPAETGEAAPRPEAVPHVAELVAQSQQLDHLLQALPERPRVERVSTAATIDTIEQRIQWLDYQLSEAPQAGLSEEQARRLWRERVDLMDSLVKVRYAEGTSF